MLLAGPAAAALPPEQEAQLRRIESYLEGVRSLEARFSQINPNGSLLTGEVLLARPGRLKITYDQPSRVVMIASDWRLVFIDGSIKQMNVLPLSQTPLSVLLSEKVALTGEAEVEVTDLRRINGELAMTLIRRKEPDQGRLTLYFSENPLELRRWTVVDAQGLATTLIIENPKLNVAIASDRLVFKDPTLFGWP